MNNKDHWRIWPWPTDPDYKPPKYSRGVERVLNGGAVWLMGNEDTLHLIRGYEWDSIFDLYTAE
ncbi:hypothetical protein [Maridesulfovibrio ferrireducens]|uniref:hypothetical protein n=1 Tax=Maridesulfovibrio ferrireducens TaxID=246191 RepID=UPI001A184535|nr:hypothetical protein [Maridesulfovibrio ferrireducens]MBI9113251.1 hypothetical protein [Maridesulfovibrio ferrireducens]